MVVGTIVQHEERILLCRRGIEPQRGLWTVPAGGGWLVTAVILRGGKTAVMRLLCWAGVAIGRGSRAASLANPAGLWLGSCDAGALKQQALQRRTLAPICSSSHRLPRMRRVVGSGCSAGDAGRSGRPGAH